MAAPLKVLVIGYTWPEPAATAAGGHMMQLLRVFQQQGWPITFASPAQSGQHRLDLAALGIDQVPIALNCSSFDRFIAQLQPDLVVFDRFLIEEQFGWRVQQHCPQAVRVLETSDLHSLRQARQQRLNALLKQNPSTPGLFQHSATELYEAMAGQTLTLREVGAILRCDLSLMISSAEVALLQQGFGIPPSLLHHCPFMVEPLPAPTRTFAERRDFVTVGNFRHGPNWDAVLWLKQAIWPAIRARLPGARMQIYGAYTPAKASALHNPEQGFHINGWAEDALHVMQRARVLLAPLRFGAGIKGKLLEAMQCGTPSVTTPIGAEGMGDPWPGAVAGNAGEFATVAVALYQDPVRWAGAQARGFTLLGQAYGYATHAAALAGRLHALRSDLAGERRRNFTGALLRHHLHQSTRYMAQWIEAKRERS
ncbi:glycosyltransferase [Pseudomonas typographi]|uniref:Glycosyltransferase n=1 Tax=Pseudomonas typographi TaxID=2715964 RepID=A0ABR7Z736_9PSED|nr:glycosyltransferase [Pseudomonas typographi]MBD1588490.1 glycosyltransferase [Pseudomonas typographi]MBD1601192.1 glycosyltransferase [Pseudomonas typographi]